MKTFPDPVVERLILERIKFEHANEIPTDVLTNLTVEQLVNWETRAVRTLFKTFIPGREVRKEVVDTVIVYGSWWQHFKETYFTAFLKRRFPVKSHREAVTIKHYHICPHTGAETDIRQREFCFEFLNGLEPEPFY